jgi:hypothetical protein
MLNKYLYNVSLQERQNISLSGAPTHVGPTISSRKSATVKNNQLQLTYYHLMKFILWDSQQFKALTSEICENGNEPLVCINNRDILNQLNNYQLLKQDTASCRKVYRLQVEYTPSIIHTLWRCITSLTLMSQIWWSLQMVPNVITSLNYGNIHPVPE